MDLSRLLTRLVYLLEGEHGHRTFATGQTNGWTGDWTNGKGNAVARALGRTKDGTGREGGRDGWRNDYGRIIFSRACLFFA